MRTSILLFSFFLIMISVKAANYRVQIDYHHPSLKYTDTKSGITLSFFNQEGNRVHSESVKGIFPISKKARNFDFNTSQSIQYISIATNGEDAFFLDQIKIFKDGQLLKQHGGEAGKGWCLSTDNNDTFGAWKNNIVGSCRPSIKFIVEEQNANGNEMPTTKLEGAVSNATTPSRVPSASEQGWVYQDNEMRREINAEGLGRCYDIRFLDPINWSNESLVSGQRASVISLVRDDSRRPARHNNKDYVVPKGVVFSSEIIGDSEAESRYASTSYEFEQEVLKEYRADVGVPKVGSASGSAAFSDVQGGSGSQSSLYVFSKMYKQFYKLDLYFDDPRHQHYMDARFWNAVKYLGQGMSAEEFVQKFGTHYASTTYYGGNFMQRRTVQQSEYSFYESNASEFKLDAEGTIKKVNFSVGATRNERNGRGETESLKMSAAKIFTVGGDLNQYRPDLWAQSVLNNLAVVKVRLSRISDLLTAKNFPQISNIQEKQKLLQAAIQAAEKQALSKQSLPENSNFFQKKPAKYRLTVTYMKCLGHGSKEPGSNSEYFGNIRMGMYTQNGGKIGEKAAFSRSDKQLLDMAVDQSVDLNVSLTKTISPKDIQSGYITVFGKLSEKDLAAVQLSNHSKHATQGRIYFRNALHQESSKSLLFSNKYGDKIRVHFKLRRI